MEKAGNREKKGGAQNTELHDCSRQTGCATVLAAPKAEASDASAWAK